MRYVYFPHDEVDYLLQVAIVLWKQYAVKCYRLHGYPCRSKTKDPLCLETN